MTLPDTEEVRLGEGVTLCELDTEPVREMDTEGVTERVRDPLVVRLPVGQKVTEAVPHVVWDGVSVMVLDKNRVLDTVEVRHRVGLELFEFPEAVYVTLGLMERDLVIVLDTVDVRHWVTVPDFDSMEAVKL